MIRILYDGECPFCAGYVRFNRLRQRLGEVELIDAREATELVEAYAAKGHDIDESFIVDTGGTILSHGAAMAFIHANLSPGWTGLPLLANEKLLQTVYPSLRAMRNGALHLLGVSKIRAARQPLEARADFEEEPITPVEKGMARTETP
ncbi:MAG: DUF393 domain-containing protein [Parvularculaceae bacterium]|nr:DUF393 domain-containing protein [Parvularculaceae bacterium]